MWSVLKPRWLCGISEKWEVCLSIDLKDGKSYKWATLPLDTKRKAPDTLLLYSNTAPYRDFKRYWTAALFLRPNLSRMFPRTGYLVVQYYSTTNILEAIEWWGTHHYRPFLLLKKWTLFTKWIKILRWLPTFIDYLHYAEWLTWAYTY